MLEVDLGSQHSARPVGHFQSQGPPQHPQIHGPVRDGCKPKPLPGRGVDPVPEPPVTDVEGEPAEQQGPILWAVVQLLGEFDGAIDRLDDDPFVVGSAERLAFDDLAGDPEPGVAGNRLLGRAAAADP